MHPLLFRLQEGDSPALEPVAEAVQETATNAPLFSGPTGIMWAVVIICLVVFILLLSLIMRGRVIRAHEMAERANSEDLEPVDAETTQNDEDHHDPDDIFALQEEPTIEATQIPPLPLEDATSPSDRPDMEAEIVTLDDASTPDDQTHQDDDTIELFDPASSTTDEQPKKKKSLFGFLGRKNKPDAEIEEQPTTDTGTPAFRGSRHLFQQKDPEMIEDRARLARMEEEEARRYDPEAVRRIAEENERRLAAVEERLMAQREADFERRKQDAAAEQLAKQEQTEKLERTITRALDEKIATLSEKLDQQAVTTPPVTLLEAETMAITELGDTLLGKMQERFQALSQRMDDNEHAFNVAISTLTDNVASLATGLRAPQQMDAQINALRRDIAALHSATLSHQEALPAAQPQPDPLPLVAHVQLADIVRNTLPPESYDLGALLSNNRKADCLLHFPTPPGPMPIDARFPIEALDKLHRTEREDGDMEYAENEFRRTMLRYLVDINERLIMPEETGNAAMMFVPSEQIAHLLHARFNDIVQDASRARVWIVSPTSLMATLNAMRGVMRGFPLAQEIEATKQETLQVSKDVNALRAQMEELGARHQSAAEEARAAHQTADGLKQELTTSISTQMQELRDDLHHALAEFSKNTQPEAQTETEVETGPAPSLDDTDAIEAEAVTLPAPAPGPRKAVTAKRIDVTKKQVAPDDITLNTMEEERPGDSDKPAAWSPLGGMGTPPNKT